MSATLENLDGNVLARLWPASMVVTGLKVSKTVRNALRANTEKVIFRRARCSRTMRAATATIDFCRDLLQFQHRSLEVELHLENAYPTFIKIWEGAARAIANEFSGRIVLLNIGSDGEQRHASIEVPALPSFGSQRVEESALSNSGSQLTLDMHAESIPAMQFLRQLDLSSTGMLSWSDRMMVALTNLKSLRISSNTVAPPDARRLACTLQQLPGLERLDLADCRVVPRLEALQSCTSLVHLDMSRTALGRKAEELDRLCARLPNLRLLNLAGNQLGSPSLHDLVETLGDLRNLTSLDLSDNRIGGWGAGRLAEHLPELPALTALSLAWNRIGDGGVTALANAFPRFEVLQRLNVAGNSIQDAGGGMLMASLMHLTTLLALDVSANHLSSWIAQRMAEEAADACPFLSSLNLSYVGIDRIPAAVMSGLARCSALTELRLGGNQLEPKLFLMLRALLGGQWTQDRVEELSGRQTRKHAQARADRVECAAMLRRVDTLRVLELAGCRLGPAGAGWVGEGVRGLSRLQRLALGGNKIMGAGMKLLVVALPELPSLSSLDLSGNVLDDSAMEGLAAVASQCVSLQRLDLGWNRVGSRGLAHLAGVLPACSRLEDLGLAYNGIDDGGLRSLSSCVGQCWALGRIKLGGNAITLEGATVLVEASRRCRALHEVDLRGLVALKEGRQPEEISESAKRICREKLSQLAEGLLRILT